MRDVFRQCAEMLEIGSSNGRSHRQKLSKRGSRYCMRILDKYVSRNYIPLSEVLPSCRRRSLWILKILRLYRSRGRVSLAGQVKGEEPD